ncbi:16S rRNA (cytosine(967)-C(5))-methyltransferase RsmB [Dolosicoccus paucivorans]|uniref:16S rRNA (cytosine(967)-C(5))-methyltransferase RsmB n=1 Tax=Dolosicoccus paucivorans TaxID=84521 RepID=UPI00087DFF64|nr:16S rRNA (cytosine(967)-C(5))-methyltransferase RsmB [Dolosicoccus paucivorans]SDI29224.1 16S rRNA (cytosine967-C5)-methyltransferase [Dolosicoccus paucivorans]
MKIKKRAQQQFAGNPRWQALTILYQVEYQKEYSNVLIQRMLQNTSLEERDSRLVVELVYGVIQRRKTLDYYLSAFIKGKKIDPWVLTLLRLTLYQMEYLDRIPNRAAIHEAVEIAKTNGHQGLGKFVNAILRRIQREGVPSFEAIKPLSKRLAIQYSIDEWIVEDLLETFDGEKTAQLLASLLERPYVSARINAPSMQRKQLIDAFQALGYDVQESKLSPVGIRFMTGNPVNSPLFEEGKITIQDESSMLVAPLGDIKGDERVLDACAAPGGKATHIASLLTTGHLTALDISKRKLNKVDEHLQRMHLDEKVTTHVADASKFVPKNDELYDIIYLDAPCSGLGLMRRKPEIKYEKTRRDIIQLSKIQEKLLDHMATLLKPGGTLIYSTCTLTQLENETVLKRFLEKHEAFSVDPIKATEVPEDILTPQGFVRVWPHQYHTDGFFIGRLTKSR